MLCYEDMWGGGESEDITPRILNLGRFIPMKEIPGTGKYAELRISLEDKNPYACRVRLEYSSSSTYSCSPN